MPSDIQLMERKNNISAIIKAIRINRKMTRRELMNRLNLSWGCISELIALLIDEGIVVETEIEEPASRGRIPTALMLAERQKVLGLDVNRVGISVCVCNLYGEMLFEHTMALNAADCDSVLVSLFSAIETARKAYSDIVTAGIAMQGMKEVASDIWNFPADKAVKIDFERDIASKLDIPVMIEHDPNCMLLSLVEESVKETKMLVRIDSGVGASIYKSNRFFDNEPLELGYTVCGENGERLSSYIKKCGFDSDTPPSAEAINRAGSVLGVALGNFCNLISLDEIILCGEFMKHGAELLSVVEKTFSETVIQGIATRITTSFIKNASFGAAKLALDAFPYLRGNKT